MRNTKRNQTRKTHRRKAKTVASIKRKRLSKRTMKGGVINNQSINRTSWASPLRPVTNNTTKKNNKSMSNVPNFGQNSLKVTVSKEMLSIKYPNNTICKDTVNDAWELKYFTLNEGETATDASIDSTIGVNTTLSGKYTDICVSENEYYRKLVSAGLVNYITTLPSIKYKVIPQVKQQQGTKLYVYKALKSTIYNGTDMPNTGSIQLKITPRDDAAAIRIVRVRDIANGTYAMPFLHVWFALEYYKKCNSADLPANLLEQLDVVYNLSRLRNHRIMRAVNARIDEANISRGGNTGKKLVQHFAYDFSDAPNEDEVKAKAAQYGVKLDAYYNEASDKSDIDECSNGNPRAVSFNFDNQKDVPGAATDNVQIITDLDNEDWLILIVREFGPGKNLLAWAGGFVDPGETHEAAGERELEEEMKQDTDWNSDPNVTVEMYKTIISDPGKLDWDPRANLCKGVKVTANVRHRYLFRNEQPRNYKCIGPVNN
jgi:hypothetical protein